MDFTEKMQHLKMLFRDYIEALEDEHHKIPVFSKKLPLSWSSSHKLTKQ